MVETRIITARDSELSSFGGQVSDSGEERCTLQAAIDEGIPAPVISAALFAGFSCRGQSDFADKLLSAIRDVIQNHLLQVLAFLTMDPPAGGPTRYATRKRVSSRRFVPSLRWISFADNIGVIGRKAASLRIRRLRPMPLRGFSSTVGAGRMCLSRFVPGNVCQPR
jgi:hypothetical protein